MRRLLGFMAFLSVRIRTRARRNLSGDFHRRSTAARNQSLFTVHQSQPGIEACRHFHKRGYEWLRDLDGLLGTLAGIRVEDLLAQAQALRRDFHVFVGRDVFERAL